MTPAGVDALLRELTPRVLSTVARRYEGFDRCEDAVQEALLAAATQWPSEGVPDNPAGWLVRVASRRWIEGRRQDDARRRREEATAGEAEPVDPPPPPTGRDDSLTLLTLCCHPSLSLAAQVALTLRAVGGLTTAQIARGLLVPEATVGQRISRAKARLRADGARFTPPTTDDLPGRLAAVCRVLYLVFTEGHTSSGGTDLQHVELADEAIRLARLLREDVPDDGEVAGLLALFLLTDARRAARTDDRGRLVPLAEQDRSRWDQAMIAEGVALLEATLPHATVGPYQLQAAVAAVHAEAPTADATDWREILGLYDVLAVVAPGPMVTLSRVVALAAVHGPRLGLQALDAVAGEPALARHHRVDAVRAHLLAEAGDTAGAREAYARAAAGTSNTSERDHLLARARTLAEQDEPMPPTTTAALRNWSGNVTFTPTELARPATVEQLQELVAGSRRIRALGSGHSFSTVADTDGVLVSVRDLAGDIEVDAATGAVTVPAGATYGQVGAQVQRAGRALHNTGSLPHIVVAGACATGTHGSGNGNRNLPAGVSAVEFVRADGELVTLSRDADPDVFGGAVLSLGALGIVTRLTLDTEPTFDVRQDLWQDIPFDRLLAEIDDVMASAYSVSVFTDWSRPDVVDKVWAKSRVDAFTDHPDDWLGGHRATAPQHAIVGEDPAGATEQLGVPGPWNARLPHFRIEFTPSSGAEIQSEYLLPREHTADALAAVRGLAHRYPGVLQVFELRTVAADELWASPSYGRDTVGLHFTWVLDIEKVRPVLAELEAAIARFEPRPHWGKVFTIPTDEVRARYPRLPDLAALVARFDPEAKFANAFTDPYLRA